MAMQNLIITAELVEPFIMNGVALLTPFDSLVAAMAVERARAAKDLLPDELREIIDNLPIRKVAIGNDYLYAASMPTLADDYTLEAETIYKSIRVQRFLDVLDAETLVDAIKKRYIGAVSGSYKQGAPKLNARLASSISWTLNADKKAVEDLLSNLTHIGKKRSIGFGLIKKLDINEAADNAPIVRPLPVEFYNVDPFMTLRLKPAYWEADCRMLSGIGEVMTSRRGNT